ncbi:alpha-glucosidase 2 [Aphomia sociella]
MANSEKKLGVIMSIIKADKYFVIQYETQEQARLYVLNSHVFRYYMSPTGNFLDYPIPNNPTDIARINIKTMEDYDESVFEKSFVEDIETLYIVHTNKINIIFDKIRGTMSVRDNRTTKEVFNEVEPLCYADKKATQVLRQHKDEFFFGGGMQNGRFTHKGKIIKIDNTNNWVDGGVTSPCPFYWSTYGYGVLRNTWQQGIYDFGSKTIDKVITIHKNEDFDVFFFINSHPKDILTDYYELTGKPIFMPEYAFYEAHLNTFNRDYWVKVDSSTPLAILFEDGFYYKSYKPDEINDKSKGILESLNGEKNNYQFSARAMVDRYKMHDMPLGWFIPNDGYGSGYGQTDTLEGDIENLKQFANYARSNGVEVALWTESNLEPVDPLNPKKGDRDLDKEVSVAGVIALKCDVAWIGCGYSFALNAVEHASEIYMRATKHNNRKMIIMVDGWAGTQRHSGIWSGDQYGGNWEYIRFHIPTYIGAGLSGLPVVGSDMDGIYGGGDKDVNIRDYQWKTFTPLQLNMDGWGSKPKYPFSYDDEAISINRAYLKLKSMLMPYNYTIGYEATQGLPMIRAMFIDFPQDTLAYTTDTQYQYMWGPSILVAPIYNDQGDGVGRSMRHEIYLPDSNQIWIDMFTGEKFQGGKVLNNVYVPLWKIPVFIKNGAIIPMTNPNNNPNEIKRHVRMFNIYPSNKSSFDAYEDDGFSSAYLTGHFALTKITSYGPKCNENKTLQIHIDRTKGYYEGMIKERSTELRIMASRDIDTLKVAVNGVSIKIIKAQSEKEFDSKDNIYYFNKNYIVNPYLAELAGEELYQSFLMIKINKMDVTKNDIQIKIHGYENESRIYGKYSTVNNSLKTPELKVVDEEITATSISLQWNAEESFSYEIEKDGVIYTNVIGNHFRFDNLKDDTKYTFRIRLVKEGTVSEWSNYHTVLTKEDPIKFTIEGVKVSCNLPCQPSQEVCNLTDGDLNSIWHTNWGKTGRVRCHDGHYITLQFDLGDVYNINKIEYIPRQDAGNGTFLKIEYRVSIDDVNWSQILTANFSHDESAKILTLEGLSPYCNKNGLTTFRYMELKVLNSVGEFGSGRQILFYKA